MTREIVAIDSQCLTYLIQALAQRPEAASNIEKAKVALVRAWLYGPSNAGFYLLPNVIRECRAIREPENLEFHEASIFTLFPPLKSIYPIDLSERVASLCAFHSGTADCQNVAEAEYFGASIFVSEDSRLVRNLEGRTKIETMNAEAYWARLGITKGSIPTLLPRLDNPLSKQGWWRW